MAADQPRVVAAATDGACSGNPGPGGWGALLRFEDGSVLELGGAAANTTNNRMELAAALAVLEELKQLPLHPDLQLRTDSRYLIDGLGKWMAGWKRKGWRTASGAPVLNKDLWEALDRARLPAVPLVHVRGHSGDPDNDRCDAIAVAFSKGGTPRLATGPAAATTKAAASPVDPAPAALAQLLSRLELADRLASGGYALRLPELAQLVELPLSRLEEKEEAWTWRDWQVSPAGEDRWRLERL
ncbi:ribonuclease HI [Synechococcus sp. CS-602]|uniref:ribonuclease H family protein n=1 Tax=unclassified Synechococcus TaxID=2626047 RepID=UPI0008FF0F8E|nr:MULTISPECIES: ribonuclease H [unclassified Synechococcus]APD47913.1 ribonuclease HI [Synechococcus sp. SynAce01]MCT0204963.1 ribonuclease HI [Synechococcus sp. CS-602]MCT0244791.1 ribonuclease HI [Synechococcus sp. CS-601]